jgi:hypothetical protein
MTVILDPEVVLDLDDLIRDLRLAQFLLELNCCSPQRAIALIRKEPTASPLERLAYAMAASRHETAAADEDRLAPRML